MSRDVCGAFRDKEKGGARGICSQERVPLCIPGAFHHALLPGCQFPQGVHGRHNLQVTCMANQKSRKA